jgi:hypothetical protein
MKYKAVILTSYYITRVTGWLADWLVLCWSSQSFITWQGKKKLFIATDEDSVHSKYMTSSPQ